MAKHDDEWGPWIEHDGSGCPCIGRLVELEWQCPEGGIHKDQAVQREADAPAWDWENYGQRDNWTIFVWGRVLRYRILRPRALRDLIALANDVPADTRRREPATVTEGERG